MLESMAKQAEKGWSFFKKILGLLSLWGLIFSLVTIGGLRVGFDYDDTLVFSTPAFSKAFRSGSAPFSPAFWEVVNTSYDLEKPKMLTNAMAWLLRILGFRIAIISSRPDYGGEGLKKEWRRLTRNFIFAGDSSRKHVFLRQANYVLYFGDSDSDILEGRMAHVLSLRVRRSPQSSYKEDYHPGTLREFIIPLSEY